MGHRASYVLITGDNVHTYRSHWGALSIPEKLLSGPEKTAAYLRALTPAERLLDSTWVEGGILLDADQHTLLFWGGEIVKYFPHARRLFLPIVRTLWPGWTVQWAVHGIADFAHYLGRAVSEVLTGSFEEGFDDPATFEELLHQDAESNTTVVTVKHADGRVADYVFQYLPGFIFSTGPMLLDALAHKEPVPQPHERPNDDFHGGAYFDLATQAMWVWNCAILDPRYLHALARAWPGWSIHGHVEGIVRQIVLSGRNPELSVLAQADALAMLAVDLLSDDPRPSRDLLTRAVTEAPGGSDVTAVVASGFFNADPVALTVEERRSLLQPLLGNLLTRGDSSGAGLSSELPM